MIKVDYKNDKDQIMQIHLGKHGWLLWKNVSTRPSNVKTILKVTEVTEHQEQELYSIEKSDSDNIEKVENNVADFANTNRILSDRATNFSERQFSAPILSTPIPGRSLGPANVPLLRQSGAQPVTTTSIQNPMSISFLVTTSTQIPTRDMSSSSQVMTNSREQSASTVVSTTVTRSNEIPLKSPIKDDNDLIVIYRKGSKKIRTSKNIKGSDLNSWINMSAPPDNDIASLKDIIGIADATEGKIFSSRYIDWIKEREGTTTKKSRSSSKDRLKIFYEQDGKAKCKNNVFRSTWDNWNEGNRRKKFKSGEYVLLEEVTKVVSVNTQNVEREIYPIHHDNHTIKMTYKDPRLQTEKTMFISGDQLRRWIAYGLSGSTPFGNFKNIIKLRDKVTKKKINVDLIKKQAERAETKRLSKSTISATSNPSEIQTTISFYPTSEADYSPDFQAQSYSSPSTTPMSILDGSDVTEVIPTLHQKSNEDQESSLFPNLSVPSTPVDQFVYNEEEFKRPSAFYPPDTSAAKLQNSISLDRSANNNVVTPPLTPSAMTILPATVINLVDIKRSLFHVDLMCLGEGEPTGDNQEEQLSVSIPNLSVPATPVDLNFQRLYEEGSLQQGSFTAEKNSSNQKEKFSLANSNLEKIEVGTKYKISYTDKLAKEHTIEIPRKNWIKYRKKWQGLSVLNTSNLHAADLNLLDVDTQQITSIIQIVNGKETLIYPLVETNDIEVTYVNRKARCSGTFKMSTMLIDGRILQQWIDMGCVGIAIRDLSKITRLYDTVLKKDIDLDFIKALFVESEKKRPQKVSEKQQSPEPVLNTPVPTLSIDLSKIRDLLEHDNQKQQQSQEQQSDDEKQFSVRLFPNLSMPSSPVNLTIHLQEQEEDKRESNLPEENYGLVVHFSVFSKSNVSNASSSQLPVDNAENNITSSNVPPDQRNLIGNSISYSETVISLSSQLNTLKRKNQGNDKKENENKKKKTLGEMQGEVNQQVKKS